VTDTPGLRPVPDPTVLTTEALHREIGALRELLEQQLRNVEAKMMGHWTLDIEREATTERHFEHLDKVRGEDKREARALVDLALASQKAMTSTALVAANMAIDKAETATGKRYDSLAMIVDGVRINVASMMPRKESEARHAAHDDALSLLSTRITAIEATKVGVRENRSDARAGITAATAMVGIVVTIMVAVITFVFTIIART
jgi:hypothetical protein